MKQRLFIPIIFFFITLLFFYPILKGQIPFPGDLLVGSYAPYNADSQLGFPPGGVPNKAQGPDVIRESIPWKYFVIEQIKKGEVPFWTPYNFSGNPIMANFQSAVFYPLNIIFLIFPFTTAWSIFIFLSPFLAAIFTYLFLREINLSKIPSIFGGVVFSFSSYMVVWQQYGNITHTLLWLPLALFFTEKFIKKSSKKEFISLITTLVISLLGGYIQGYFYTIVTVCLYFILRNWEDKKKILKRLWIIFAVLLLPVLLASFQLFPTLELFPLSTRGNYTLDQIQQLLNPFWYVITVLVPDFFGNPASRNYWFEGTYIERVSYFGVIPFILAIVGLLLSKKNKKIKAFAILFVVTFLMSVDLFFTKFIYSIPIPMLSTSVPTRILSLFQFCGALLAAFGLDLLLQRKEKRIFFLSSIMSLSIILGAFFFAVLSPRFLSGSDWVTQMSIAKRNGILPLAFSSLFVLVLCFRFYDKLSLNFLKKRNIPILGIVLLLLTVADLFYFFHKITPFSPKEFLYPQTKVISYIQKNAGINRYWGYGSGHISSNFQTYDKTFASEGDDPLQLKFYNQILSSSENGKAPSVLTRLSVTMANGYGQDDLRKNIYRQKVLNVLGIKYLLQKDDSLGKDYRPDTATFDEKKYRLVWQESPWQIYENLSAAPRVFLTNDYRVISEEEKVFQTFFSKDFNERKTIILDKDPNMRKGSQGKSNVEVISYNPNKVVIKTRTDHESLLFLSDAYYPGWEARVEGKETEIYRADHAFRAVVVPKGDHVVTFTYRSKTFEIGLAVSAICAFILLLSLRGNKKI
jgi:uncharacterized membrane protein YfhO